MRLLTLVIGLLIALSAVGIGGVALRARSHADPRATSGSIGRPAATPAVHPTRVRATPTATPMAVPTVRVTPTKSHPTPTAKPRPTKAPRRKQHHHPTHRKGRNHKPKRVMKHRVPRLRFTPLHRSIGDMFGIGSYAVQRYPGIADPALKRAKLTGANWLREEFTANELHWGTSGRYRWRLYDPTVRRERRLGFHILGLLDYNNTWDGHPHSYMPHWMMTRLIRNYVRYVYTIVRHYRNSIQDWQIWNEPDLHIFWQPHPNPQDYARLLSAAYGAVKRANPRATVVLGGPSGADPNGLTFISQVVQAGGKFDVLSLQPYRDVPDLQLIREVHEARKYHKPIWFTEMGWAGEHWCMSVCGPADSQANRLARLYLISAYAGAQRVFWYDLRDDGVAADFEDHFGLLEHGLAAKPAYLAYQVSRYYLDWGHFLGIDVLKPDVFAFEIRNHHRTFVIIWNNRLDSYGLDIPWRHRTRARVLDWRGTELAKSRAKQVKLVVGSRSVAYIVGSRLQPHIFHPGRVFVTKPVRLPRIHPPRGRPGHRRPGRNPPKTSPTLGPAATPTSTR